MNVSGKYLLAAALVAAAPLARAGMLSTPELWGDDYPIFECVITNVDHPVTAVVTVDIFTTDGTLLSSTDVTLAPGATGKASYTALTSGSARCTFTIPGPAKDTKDFRAAIRMHDMYNLLGPALPAS